jgi:hypothetical protein
MKLPNHSQASSALARLQLWFASCANGEWEHRYGIGWVISVDLSATALQDRQFEVQQIDRTEQDWFRCRIEGATFRGYGGVHNLEEMIDIFLDWTETARNS